MENLKNSIEGYSMEGAASIDNYYELVKKSELTDSISYFIDILLSKDTCNQEVLLVFILSLLSPPPSLSLLQGPSLSPDLIKHLFISSIILFKLGSNSKSLYLFLLHDKAAILIDLVAFYLEFLGRPSFIVLALLFSPPHLLLLPFCPPFFPLTPFLPASLLPPYIYSFFSRFSPPLPF